MRYIYILAYKDINGDTTLCKLDINLNRIIRLGCKEADRHQERRYIIYRQPITDDGEISLYCKISPSTTRIN